MEFFPPETIADFAAINADALDTTIRIKRGETVLPAQPALLSVHQSQPSIQRSATGEKVQIDGEVRGLPNLNIAIGDIFVHGGVRFRVVFVRPDRSVATIAEVALTK